MKWSKKISKAGFYFYTGDYDTLTVNNFGISFEEPPNENTFICFLGHTIQLKELTGYFYGPFPVKKHRDSHPKGYIIDNCEAMASSIEAPNYNDYQSFTLDHNPNSNKEIPLEDALDFLRKYEKHD